jgi:hypothetical protein
MLNCASLSIVSGVLAAGAPDDLEAFSMQIYQPLTNDRYAPKTVKKLLKSNATDSCSSRVSTNLQIELRVADGNKERLKN